MYITILLVYSNGYYYIHDRYENTYRVVDHAQLVTLLSRII